jgi:hypothetical protein
MLSLPQAFGGMSGLGASFSTAATCTGWMHDHQGRNVRHANTLASYQQVVSDASASIDALRDQVNAARLSAEDALSSYPQEAAALRPVMNEIESAGVKVGQATAAVRGLLDQIVALDATAANTFNCIYGSGEHRPYPGVRKHRQGWRNVEEHRKVFQDQAAALFAQIAATAEAVNRDVHPQFLAADVAAVVSRIQAIEAQAAADAAAARQAIEDERFAREQAAAAAAAAEQAAIDARLEQEAAARQAELDFEREQIERARLLEEEARAFDAEERRRRYESELRREQMAIEAEERRMRLQQEALMRQEEREIRRQEREAQLQQLMLIQELAASGVPTDMLPPGLLPPGLVKAAQQPAQPQPATPTGMAPYGPGGSFIPPGFATPPGLQQQQVYSPYGPMVAGPGGVAPMGFAPEVPGVALMPGGIPAAPAGYAATAPQQQWLRLGRVRSRRGDVRHGWRPRRLAPDPQPEPPGRHGRGGVGRVGP